MCDVFFFFKQKTAYEMRISDWSSDVCSSDLSPRRTSDQGLRVDRHRSKPDPRRKRRSSGPAGGSLAGTPEARSEERRVGKECVSRVDLGGRRIIKKKKETLVPTKHMLIHHNSYIHCRR